jgi:heparan-alpha-glucosaminide N-acetyltransferase
VAGKPVPAKPVSPQSPPVSAPSEAAKSESSTIAMGAPLNRNSPSSSTVNAMADVSSGKKIGENRETRSRRRSSTRSSDASERLVSLDAFRGFIMMMLAAGGFGILAFSKIDKSSPVWEVHNWDKWHAIGDHFDHPKWLSVIDRYSVSFWDLIQPSFMFMVGAAMPFSSQRRESSGQGLFGRTLHAILRSVALVLLGVFLSSLGHEKTLWIFPNVLCQIGLGYFFAWVMHHWRAQYQLAALFLILAGYWGWFYMNPPAANYDYAAVSATPENGEIFEGKFAAWSKNANAAYKFDSWLLPRLRSLEEPAAEADEQNAEASEADPATPSTETPAAAENTDANAAAVDEAKVAEKPAWYRQWFFLNTEPYKPNSGGYTTLNFIPSIGTTLLGILCGQILIRIDLSKWSKLGMLLTASAICFGLGIAAHEYVCPIVKRIWTPSWVLFSGGYVIGMLALFYLLFDVLPLKLLAFPLVVVGMNSILIYMMGQTISGWMRESIVKVHLAGMIENVFGPKALDPQWYGPITLPSTVFLLYWLFLLWLYRQRIFLKL